MADQDESKQPQKPQPPAGGGGGQLPTRQVTANQQFLIWFLVIVVGLLFSMTGGGGFFALTSQRPERRVADVPQSLAESYVEIDRKINTALFGQWGLRQVAPWTRWANQIWMSRVADEMGLMPKGAALEKAVYDWGQETPLGPWGQPMGEKSRAELLAEVSGPQSVTASELKRYIQVQEANKILMQQQITTPVLPKTMVEFTNGYANDKIDLHVVRLTSKPYRDGFLDAVTEDEIGEAYEKHREAEFRRPAKRTVTVIRADRDAIAEQLIFTNEAIQAYYDEHPNRFFETKTIEPEEEGGEVKTERVRQPLEAVEAEILATLKRETAAELAQQQYERLVGAVRNYLNENNLTPQEMAPGTILELTAVATLKKDDLPNRLSADVSLRVDEGIEVPEPQEDGPFELPTVGQVRGDRDIWSAAIEPGSSREVQLTSSDNKSDNQPALLVLGDYQPSDYIPLDDNPEVAERLRRYLASRKAYGKLLSESRALRDAAANAGGLKAYFEKDGRADELGVEVESIAGQPLLAEVFTPAEQLDSSPGESRTLIGLAGDGQPIALAGSWSRNPDTDPQSVRSFGGGTPATGLEKELPMVMLVQVAEYRPAEPADSSDPRVASRYQQVIRSFQYSTVIDRLQKRQEQE